jgi:hypothetical protein
MCAHPADGVEIRIDIRSPCTRVLEVASTKRLSVRKVRARTDLQAQLLALGRACGTRSAVNVMTLKVYVVQDNALT